MTLFIYICKHISYASEYIVRIEQIILTQGSYFMFMFLL